LQAWGHQQPPAHPSIGSLLAGKHPDIGKDTPFPSSGNPLHEKPVLASELLSDFEFLRNINHHLCPKSQTGFVAYFQPIPFDSMFDPCTGNSFSLHIVAGNRA
jgi:hypothetical protein